MEIKNWVETEAAEEKKKVTEREEENWVERE
jgi:hypothetical protein